MNVLVEKIFDSLIADQSIFKPTLDDTMLNDRYNDCFRYVQRVINDLKAKPELCDRLMIMVHELFKKKTDSLEKLKKLILSCASQCLAWDDRIINVSKIITFYILIGELTKHLFKETHCEMKVQWCYQIFNELFQENLINVFYQKMLLDMEQGCLQEPNIENGTYQNYLNEKPPFKVGTRFIVNCKHGYKIRGPLWTICQRNNTWTSVNCTPNICGDPGYINHGKHIGASYTFPNKIEWVCDEGYELKGLKTQYCSTSGIWEPIAKPTCVEIACPTLAIPLHGRITLSKNYSVATYECDNSYRLVGERERVCTQSKQWSGKAPTCEFFGCPYPGDLDNGQVINKNINNSIYPVGHILIYDCNDHLISKTISCLKNGKWSGSIPKCTPFKIVPTIYPPSLHKPNNPAEQSILTTIVWFIIKNLKIILICFVFCIILLFGIMSYKIMN